MSKSLHACTASIPPIDAEVHRRIRLRRLGLQGAVANVISEHAFGEPRDPALLLAVVSIGKLIDGRQS